MLIYFKNDYLNLFDHLNLLALRYFDSTTFFVENTKSPLSSQTLCRLYGKIWIMPPVYIPSLKLLIVQGRCGSAITGSGKCYRSSG
jgi:hypothetical protein